MSETEKIRSFIAIEVPGELKRWIVDIQAQFRAERGASVNWARAEGIHLTLKFLGDVEQELLPKIEQALVEIADRIPPIELKTTTTGGFPNLRRPKVLWLGLEAGDELYRLQEDIDAALFKLGFPKEDRRFHPHLTVGRVRFVEKDCRMPEKFGEIKAPLHVWNAGRIFLMSSLLKPTGAEYAVIAEIPFRENQ
jgi:2'-5' RNA ligase